MRRLLLLRHAKSSWADPGTRDHDRALNDRGRRASTAMGGLLRETGLLPDLVLCSSARRTCETAARLDLPGDTPIEVEHDLYLAHPETMVGRIRAVPDAVRTLLVVGHNPTTHDVAVELAGSGEPAAVAALGTKYPTGALTVLRVATPWAELDTGGAQLERFVTPRELE